MAADRPFYPAPRRQTADFAFFRMHGGHTRAAPKYTNGELESLARDAAGELEKDHDVFIYFNNDYRGYAIENARKLKELLGVKEAGVHA